MDNNNHRSNSNILHFNADSSSDPTTTTVVTTSSSTLNHQIESNVNQFMNHSVDSTGTPTNNNAPNWSSSSGDKQKLYHQNFSNSDSYSNFPQMMQSQQQVSYSDSASGQRIVNSVSSSAHQNGLQTFSHSFAEAVASSVPTEKKEINDIENVNCSLNNYPIVENTDQISALPKFEVIEYPRRLSVSNNCDYVGNLNEFQNLSNRYPNLAVSGSDLLNETMALDMSKLQLSDSMLQDLKTFEKPIDQYFVDSNNIQDSIERKLTVDEYSKMLFDSRVKTEVDNNLPDYDANNESNGNVDQSNCSGELYDNNPMMANNNSDYYYNLYQNCQWSLDHLYILMLQQLAYDGFSHLATQLLREKGLPTRINPSNSLYSLVSNIIAESSRNGDFVPNQNTSLSSLHSLPESINHVIHNNHLTNAIATAAAHLASDQQNLQQPINNGGVAGVPIAQNIDLHYPQHSHQYSSTASSAMGDDSGELMIPPAPPITGNVQLYHKKEKTGLLKICAKFGTLGEKQENFNMPHGFCIGVNEDIVIADTNNHRISIFGLDGRFKFSFGQQGTQNGQLFQPRKIAMLPPAMLSNDAERPVFVVCDRGAKRSRMQLFSLEGEFIRLIDIPYMDIVSGLTTTQDRHIVIVDSVKSAVSIMNEAGQILNWFSCCPTMKEPSDIAVHKQEFFICDFKGNSVNVFNRHGTFLRKIVSDFTKFPNGIDISDTGDVMVGDSHGNRFHVTLFNDRSQYLGDLECPTLKVSRCCGLKITKSGYIVTLAKNNNHVLVMSPVKLNNHRVDVSNAT